MDVVLMLFYIGIALIVIIALLMYIAGKKK